jgi:hypothetical protein
MIEDCCICVVEIGRKVGKKMVNGHSELEERYKGSHGNHKSISLSSLV